MGEIGHFLNYKNCIYITFSSESVSLTVYATNTILDSGANEPKGINACIYYDKLTKDVVSWGNTEFEKDDKKYIRVDKFMDNLNRIFQKDEDKWDEDDKFFLKAVSNFIGLSLHEELKNRIGLNYRLDKYQFVIVISSEWERNKAEKLFRSIFIQESLISKDDHKDGLLVYTDIECICYHLQYKNGQLEAFKRGKNTLLCRLTPLENDKIAVGSYLLQISNTLFDIPNSKLFPKVLSSESLGFSQDEIINSISLFLQTEDKFSGLCMKDIEKLAENYIFNNDLPWLVADENALMEPIVTENNCLELLDERQITYIQSIRAIDICHIVGKFFLQSIKDLLPANLVKEHNFIIIDDEYSSSIRGNSSLLKWIEYMLEYIRISLGNGNKIKLAREDYDNNVIYTGDIVSGAIVAVKEFIRNSAMYCPPQILSATNCETSLSVFQNSAPSAIINIDIHLKTTVLLYSLLDDKGLVEKVIRIDKCVPSLGSFISFSKITTLRVAKEFIVFAGKFLIDKRDGLMFEKHMTKKKEITLEIENILNNSHSIGINLVSTIQRKYIKAFILMYMFYIQDITSHLNFENNSSVNIGYAITIEKLLLDNLIGTKEDFQKIIYASTLLSKNDTNKKLRIMTFEEKLIPAIQQSLKLKFLIRSNFILAQLHENYIQLTLNHVVTKFSSNEEEQEFITIEDKVIPIQNIYYSFCLSMWDNIAQNTSLIDRCHLHKKSEFDISELFSLRTKREFINNLKFILSNILDKNSSLQDTDKTIIQLGSSCSCTVCLVFDDIVNICFKPVLQEITVMLLASITNKTFFGKYADIDYFLNLVNFNNNPCLQNILKSIMEEKAEYFSPKRGIDTNFIVAPDLPSQLLQLDLNKKHSSYNGFQFGTLQQVFNSNYVFTVNPDSNGKVKYKFLNTISDTEGDTEGIELEDSTPFYLFKRGDVIHSTGLHKVFYLRGEEDTEYVFINFFEYETLDGLKDGEMSDSFENEDSIGTFELILSTGGLSLVNGIPIVVSVTYQYHTSTLIYSVRIIGNNFIRNASRFVFGELMTLNRF